ncbi:MAG: hypothetical protein RLZZ241_437 [Bacteroidota bacterium]|jgi:gliding motility-associated peptidyl-prolyl isomerase
MGIVKTKIIWIASTFLLLGCKQTEVRWPVSTRSGSFLQISASRNKQLLAEEEAQMAQIIAQDSTHTFYESAIGSPYYYELQVTEGGYTPLPGDRVTLTYNLMTWNNDTLYSESEIGTLHYVVDREALFPGLRQAVKLLQEGETAVFLFPSSMGYGYLGDKNRIGSNVPLKCKVSLFQIEKLSENISNP